MRNGKKRLDKLSANLPAKDRVPAYLDAIYANDMETADFLRMSTPLKTYTQSDAAVADTVCAVEVFSMQFDRVFCLLLAHQLSAALSVDEKKYDAQEKMELELIALVGGLSLFAGRVGLCPGNINFCNKSPFSN